MLQSRSHGPIFITSVLHLPTLTRRKFTNAKITVKHRLKRQPLPPVNAVDPPCCSATREVQLELVIGSTILNMRPLTAVDAAAGAGQPGTGSGPSGRLTQGAVRPIDSPDLSFWSGRVQETAIENNLAEPKAP